MKVSVIVPVYNVGKYLRQCLDSLVGQTLRDIEIICVNDGSTDGSGAILDEYAARDPRVKVIHQANAGAGPARNAGLDAARGEYLFFCDPDDWAKREMLERLWTKADETHADVVIDIRIPVSANTGRVREYKMPSVLLGRQESFKAAELGNQAFTATKAALWDKLFRRAPVVENGIRFQAVRHTNDLYFTSMAVVLAERIVVLPERLYYHRYSRWGSLQNTKDCQPCVYLDAVRGLRMELERRGVFGSYAGSYLRMIVPGGLRELSMFGKKESVLTFAAEFRREISSVGKMFPSEGCPVPSGAMAAWWACIVGNDDHGLLSLHRRHRLKLCIWSAIRRLLVDWVPARLCSYLTVTIGK